MRALSLLDLTDENFSWHYWSMRIAVFCSASTKIDDKYVDFAFEVGKAIA